jgi:hypothetical protein
VGARETTAQNGRALPDEIEYARSETKMCISEFGGRGYSGPQARCGMPRPAARNAVIWVRRRTVQQAGRGGDG